MKTTSNLHLFMSDPELFAFIFLTFYVLRMINFFIRLTLHLSRTGSIMVVTNHQHFPSIIPDS